MLDWETLLGRVRDYALKERVSPKPGALADIEAHIAALPLGPQRRDAEEALKAVRGSLKRLDLSVCAWPPQESRPGEEILYADSQKLVSAVLRVVHAQREVRVIAYILKGKP